MRLIVATCLLWTAGLPWAISVHGQILAVDPTNSRIVYWVSNGISRSVDAGATWSWIPSPGDVTALAIHPNEPCTLYAGIDNHPATVVIPGMPPIVVAPNGAGLYWSNNCGLGWGVAGPWQAAALIRLAITGGPAPTIIASVVQNIPGPGYVIRLNQIVRYTTTTATGDGVMEPPPNPYTGHAVGTSPSDPCIAYVGGISGRVLRNTSCGAFGFSVVGSPLMVGGQPTRVSTLVGHPTNRETILAGTDSGVLFRKDDDASDWRPITNLGGAINSLVYVPWTDGVVYAGSGGGFVSKSLDGGQSWQRVATTPGGITSIAIGTVPEFRVYAAGPSFVTLVDCGTVPVGSGDADGAGVRGIEPAATSSTLHCSFTDPNLSSGIIPIKAVHITELRARIDPLRASLTLPEFDWTDPLLLPQATSVQAVHILELRAALTELYERAGRPAPVFTDPGLAVGTVAKGIHVNELREAVERLEGVQVRPPPRQAAAGR